ncbi:MAG: aspartate-semialdehyde dehydrogenase [candidate division WOR-3 bacterium]|nr:aspartate-semialdehyde dehydrogenase [candidate division WOR-3 bacterium]
MRVIILGITGLVGRKICQIISERKLEFSEILGFASKESVGEKILINNKEIEVKELKEVFNYLNENTYVLSSLEENITKEIIPKIREKAIVIDNSSVFRLLDDVPLCVPEINKEVLKEHKNLIANPNCTTIQLVLVLHPLGRLSDFKKVVVTSLQSVSGAGESALEEYYYESEFLAIGEEIQKATDSPFPFIIVDNIIPFIGEIDENGYCKEELKIINESRKILSYPNLDITATTIRVPIAYCHSISLYIEFEKDIEREKIIEELKKESYLKVLEEEIPMPLIAKERDLVYVGRIRKIDNNRYWLFIVADNLRRGAATNAILILEELLKL